MTSAASLEARPRQPFRGIEAFRPVDHEIFFARRDETIRLLRRVVVHRGVMLFGDSGSGKSSLVNAGLIPAVCEEGFRPERLRVQPRANEEVVVERLVIREEPRQHLPSSLAADSADERVVLSLREVRERLSKPNPDGPPLLVFDQFEELVTLFEEAPSPRRRQERKQVQQEIVKLIAELLEDQSRRMKLLFVFREDYLAKLHELLAEHLGTVEELRLTPPSAASVPEIVCGPFERFQGVFDHQLSRELAGRLALEMDERSRSGAISLSELQIVSLRLWRSEAPEQLLGTKGVQGLLEDDLSEAVNRLPKELRYPAISLLSRMITASGARNVVSEADLIDHVTNEEDIQTEVLTSALEALQTKSPFVRREVRHTVPFYEITSEFLAPWIRRQREGFHDPALNSARARWRRDLRASKKALDSEDEAERRRAVDLLVSLMFQTRDIDPALYSEAMNRLMEIRDDPSIAVRKKAEQGYHTVLLMDTEEASPLLFAAPSLRSVTRPGRNGDHGLPARRLLTAGAFFLALGVGSALLTGLLLEVLDLANTSGLPDFWPWLAAATGLVWAVPYGAEALDSVGVGDSSILGAPMHPYSEGLGIIESAAAWPLNFLISWGVAYAAAAAANAWLGMGFDASFTVAILVTTGSAILAYVQAVYLI